VFGRGVLLLGWTFGTRFRSWGHALELGWLLGSVLGVLGCVPVLGVELGADASTCVSLYPVTYKLDLNVETSLLCSNTVTIMKLSD
jgi:hypothetical protein